MAERIEKVGGHTVTTTEFADSDIVVLHPNARIPSDVAHLLDMVFSDRQPLPILIIRHVSSRGKEFAQSFPIHGILDDTCSDEILREALNNTLLSRMH